MDNESEDPLEEHGDSQPDGQSGGETPLAETGVVIVDHGSRRAASNEMLLQVVEHFRQVAPYRIVEPAHMELAPPSIEEAFAACVAHGAKRIVVFPYFLLPGRHWSEDIPTLSLAASERHGQIPFLVAAPLGTHELMSRVILDRIGECTQQAAGALPECDVCAGTGRCQWHAPSVG